MAQFLLSIDEAIDRKFIITKSMPGQARVGTLIHVMDSSDYSGITVDYRVTETGEDYTATFATVKQFCKWVRPDTFIARHYNDLTTREIMNYIKATSRNFTNFYLPIALIVVVIAWIALFVCASGALRFVLGGLLTVALPAAAFLFYKMERKSKVERLYSKVMFHNWGVVLK